MKMPESFFSRAVLAYLPLAIYPFRFEQAWVAAALIVAVYWLTLTVFWFTRRFFPAGTIRTVFFFWMGLWGQLAWTCFGLFPLWLVSVFLLVPAGFLDEEKTVGRSPVFSKMLPRYFADRILAGLGFFVFVGALELAGGFLGNFGHSAILYGPAGVFFLLSLAAFLWRNQPVRR